MESIKCSVTFYPIIVRKHPADPHSSARLRLARRDLETPLPEPNKDLDLKRLDIINFLLTTPHTERKKREILS
jgi:CBS-domain-containing membrane protein